MKIVANERASSKHQFENVSKPGARADFVESENSNPKFNLYDVIQDGPNLKLAKTEDSSPEDEPEDGQEDGQEDQPEFEIDESFRPNFVAYEEEIHDSFEDVEQKPISNPKSDLELMNELKAKVFDYTDNFQNFETGNFSTKTSKFFQIQFFL